ncbi:MAG: hypothetical protein R3F19_17720 [Verrucomicrobiales bacterium]
MTDANQQADPPGSAVFALRNDLGTYSDPFVLVRYKNPQMLKRFSYKVYGVLEEKAPYFFQYSGTAATVIQAPYPISTLPPNDKTIAKSGPAFKDRKSSFWARSEGQVIMGWNYTARADFFFPTGASSRAGVAVPLLDKGTNVPRDVSYSIAWPEIVAELRTGQSVFTGVPGGPKELPAINGQASVRFIHPPIYHNAGGGPRAKLFDFIAAREVELNQLPVGMPVQNRIDAATGISYIEFPQLPMHLRKRLRYSSTDQKLRFHGFFGDNTERWVLPNMITERDQEFLNDSAFHLNSTEFRTAINQLIAAANDPIRVTPNTDQFSSMALSAGDASEAGFITLIFNNAGDANDPSPISAEVIRITNTLDSGGLFLLEADSAFDERSTVTFVNDLAGQADDYEFQWKIKAASEQKPNPENWDDFPANPANGFGAVDITIGGPGIFTLRDNHVTCRYRPRDGTPTAALLGLGVNEWSAFAEPQLIPGWIKRVLAGINPFDQRFKDLADPTRDVNTLVSMIGQAGKRWEGSVPLSDAQVDNLGLIEVYETVLRRGMSFSVDGTPSINYQPANDALLLAAGRISDLYMLLGNDAFADAADPTIKFPAQGGQFTAATSTLHTFMGLRGGESLLTEELSLLRGHRDATEKHVRPGSITQNNGVYNRLIWNFNQNLEAQTAYTLNYGVSTVADAEAAYPQGHGDAWGHYLTAIKNFYRLLRHPNYAWVPRADSVLINNVEVTRSDMLERRFARAAAARARTGAEIVKLVHRETFSEDPNDQWKGYKDEDPERAWGLSEWGSRAGQGAYLDWVVGNAILPADDTLHSGIDIIDRTTVLELGEVASAITDIQAEIDKADLGLNPLGLVKNVLPFDISPAEFDAGKSHFEQIYDRAVTAMNNAITSFNRAEGSSSELRRQFDQEAEFNRSVEERNSDFKSRLIEIFGYPYDDDIGNGLTYPRGYDGPDVFNFMSVDVSELLGIPQPATDSFVVEFDDITDITADGHLSGKKTKATFHLSKNGLGFIKPGSFAGKRRAPGEIQMARSDVLQAKARFDRGQLDYDNLIARIEDQAARLEAQYDLNATEIEIQNTQLKTTQSLNDAIRKSRERQLDFRTKSRITTTMANAVAEAFPGSVFAGTTVGGDLTSFARSAIRVTGATMAESLTQNADRESLKELDHQQAKEIAQSQTSIKLATLRSDIAIQQQVAQIEDMIRNEAMLRLEILTLAESMQQAAGRYQAALARGQRLLADQIRFKSNTADQVRERRYKDMAFRIFRNDALQKYRAQFDLAAAYVYMAAQAYDWETNLLGGDGNQAGQNFLTDIIRTRAIGEISDGRPKVGSGNGDGGLADPMARMESNFLPFKGQLGINNPQTETNRFSLRKELFRIPAAGRSNDTAWRDQLRSLVVEDVLDLPEFQRFCRPFLPQEESEPAIVIPFSTTVNFGLNYFSWPSGPGDSFYDSTNFATKIRSVGIWFSNYNTSGLAETPRVYLIPAGNDVLRSPRNRRSDIREWKILDQRLPAPFPIGKQQLDSNPGWIPMHDSVTGDFTEIRQYSSFRAFHDSGNFNQNEVSKDSRLIGRSVWNTRWLLIIPAGTLLNDRDEALARFIDGREDGDERDGNGIKDILLFFQTYSHSGG